MQLKMRNSYVLMTTDDSLKQDEKYFLETMQNLKMTGVKATGISPPHGIVHLSCSPLPYEPLQLRVL